MTPDLRTITIARDIAAEEAATAYDAMSEEMLELRAEVAGLRREILTLRCGLLAELERLREALLPQGSVLQRGQHPGASNRPRRDSA